MDYKRIYEELIEHRKMLPKLEGVYYERHHIVARCMGGGDEIKNLIYLTAEDHYFAHKVMAYAYGGNLWIALRAMTACRYGHRVSRKEFSRLKEEAAKRIGIYTMSYTEYEFRDLRSGEVFTTTQKGLREIYGFTAPQTSALVTGSIKVLQKKVALSSTVLKDKKLVKQPRPKEVSKHWFRCVVSGEKFYMTRYELARSTGFQPDAFLDLVNGRSKTRHGFCLDSTTDFNIYRTDSKRHRFRDISSGEVFERTVYEFYKEFNLERAGVRSLISGRYKRYRGFCMDSTPADDTVFIRKPRGSVYTLRRISDNSLHVGTARELSELCGFEFSALSRLVVGKSKTIKGYELVRQPPEIEEVAPESVTELYVSSEFQPEPEQVLASPRPPAHSSHRGRVQQESSQ